MACTGIFPKPGEDVPAGPLELLKCGGCGLVQLGHNYDPGLLYGGAYGYRSGLNQSMVRHLGDVVRLIEDKATLHPGDIVVDIGSNDGTLLRQYRESRLHRVGIDPTAMRFAEFYPAGVQIVPRLFDAGIAADLRGRVKAVTSIAMFYDLPNPLAFARDVISMLADKGIWLTEQSYLPAMCAANAYDTICHEHFEYYTLADFYTIAGLADAEIVGLGFNDVNGGSFTVALARKGELTVDPEVADRIAAMLAKEKAEGYRTAQPLIDLAGRAERQRGELRNLLKGLRRQGKKVLGYGASTKGNVMLQYCGIDKSLIPAIAEINEDKLGRVTPGTGIPIISEAEARVMRPDYFLVMPWHFREGIIKRERDFLAGGGKLIFPLPEVEVIG